MPEPGSPNPYSHFDRSDDQPEQQHEDSTPLPPDLNHGDRRIKHADQGPEAADRGARLQEDLAEMDKYAEGKISDYFNFIQHALVAKTEVEKQQYIDMAKALLEREPGILHRLAAEDRLAMLAEEMDGGQSEADRLHLWGEAIADASSPLSEDLAYMPSMEELDISQKLFKAADRQTGQIPDSFVLSPEEQAIFEQSDWLRTFRDKFLPWMVRQVHEELRYNDQMEGRKNLVAGRELSRRLVFEAYLKESPQEDEG